MAATTKNMSVTDPITIFEKYTIDEVRNLEKGIRAEIEKKKEDLRQMVGERYRDLIEAADTIKDMKKSAEQVVQSIRSMQARCELLAQQVPQGKGRSAKFFKPPQRVYKESHFYAVAAQIKLLLDIPEKIWATVDAADYLRATQLYLLARHIHTGLHLDSTSPQSAHILAHFPVLSRQWSAISQFKPAILQGCRQMLSDASVSQQVTTDCLCAILLLEDSTPRQMFAEFLLARAAAIRRLFSGGHQVASIRSLVCDVATLVPTTTRQIRSIFYSGEADDAAGEPNLLLATLARVTDSDQLVSGWSAGAPFLKHLPASVTDFRPVLRAPAARIKPGYLQQSCQQWINACLQDVRGSVAGQLAHVDTVRALAGMRDAAWQALRRESSACGGGWEATCADVLARCLDVWAEFLRPLFLARVQEIIKCTLETIIDSVQHTLSAAQRDITERTGDKLLEFETNVLRYVWTESAGDMPANVGWQAALSRSDRNSGALLMKSKALTPFVQKVCQQMEQQLQQLLVDVNSYLTADDSTERAREKLALYKEEAEKEAPSLQRFDETEDADSVMSHQQAVCRECLSRLLDHINEELERGGQELSLTESRCGSYRKISSLLLLGRFCTGLAELSPSLQQCLTKAGPRTGHEGSPLLRILSTSKLQSKSKDEEEQQQQEEEVWQHSRAALTDTWLRACRLWADHTAAALVATLRSSLLDARGAPALLRQTPVWENIEIQEEAEEGETVSSIIRVPAQASWYIHTLLSDLCMQINQVGGHAFNRSVLQEVVRKTADGVIAAYERLRDVRGGASKGDAAATRLSQTRALQLLFDIRFVSSILVGRDDSEVGKALSERVERLTDEVESHIDPFDLDVFAPHIRNNLSRHVQRCQVMLGAVTGLDRLGLYASTRALSSGGQEQHNVLLLSASAGVRFPLLPVSSQHPPPLIDYLTPQSPLAKSQSVPSMVDSVDDASSTDSQSIHRSATSFFEAMSTSWFGGGR
ncbi:PREDICTED: conserved oligomeric Golgi complex subunit 1-like isoform X2 [Priapulus caudatus]|uniref:Conserved oligomeric Golgi complex subunit 1 n=1 Tax=Priapulus caudatus TaxID=37621 RepID=A0ABM1E2A7_PRICU|nr:PREDICTED: conserved oligomeric Golgi complex subunit 1-like isoform X2 [Priapulus caudatus]